MVGRDPSNWLAFATNGCRGSTSTCPPDANLHQGPTVVAVNSTILHSGVKRLGMNLGNQDFYDSQQILQNLVSRNPGFEGRMWQTVLQCGKATATSCVDVASGNWPEGFLDGATYEVISGAATGSIGSVLHSSASDDHNGTTLTLGAAQTSALSHGAPNSLAANDFVVVRKVKAGDATDGWAVQASSGASIVTELSDLAPHTSGLQAVRIRASQGNQYASLSQYFDSTIGHTYIRMQGPYTIRFRGKALAATDWWLSGCRERKPEAETPSSRSRSSLAVAGRTTP